METYEVTGSNAVPIEETIDADHPRTAAKAYFDKHGSWPDVLQIWNGDYAHPLETYEFRFCCHGCKRAIFWKEACWLEDGYNFCTCCYKGIPFVETIFPLS